MSAGSTEVTHVYADGGCILANPSEYGGTWAFRHVNLAVGDRVDGRSGVITNERFGALVTNNAMEFYAILRALEALPDGWSGVVGSDSQCTIQRWKGANRSFKGIPWEWSQRMMVVIARLGQLDWLQLVGHPSAADIERGYKLKTLADGTRVQGGPVSKWQAECDRQCTKLAAEYRDIHGIAPPYRAPIVFEPVCSTRELVESGPFAPLAGFVAALP